MSYSPQLAQQVSATDQPTQSGTANSSLIPCAICLCNPTNNVCVTDPCGHIFCKKCLATHVAIETVEKAKFPTPCPTCWEPLDLASCLELLTTTGHKNAFERLNYLSLEQLHHHNLKYCSNAKCGTPFDFEREPRLDGNPLEFKLTCPICTMETCVKCHTSWHAGTTCEENEVGKNERELMVLLAAKKGWKNCPGCNVLVERQVGDCSFVRCRCGVGFCHNCGIKYKNMKVTWNNLHGEPGCNCGLFGHLFNEIPPMFEMLRRDNIPDIHEAREIALRGGVRIGTWGRNGNVDLTNWIEDYRKRRKLPVAMRIDLQRCKCPYRECQKEFGSGDALEQHLADVRRHNVWLCCGRPFYTRRAKNDHTRDVHGANV